MIPKIIFLDFDGVIIDSNGIKDEAFASIFSEYPDHRDEMMNYHLKHNAVPRGDKFLHVGRSFLQLSGDSLEIFVKEKIAQFEDQTHVALVKCPECDGAVDFLNSYKNRSVLILVSATPLKDLKLLLQERNLIDFFAEVHGAPIKKSEVLSSILAARGVDRNESCFIGDSPEDLVAARQAAVPFVGIVGRTNFKGENIPVYSNLGQVSFGPSSFPNP